MVQCGVIPNTGHFICKRLVRHGCSPIPESRSTVTVWRPASIQSHLRRWSDFGRLVQIGKASSALISNIRGIFAYKEPSGLMSTDALIFQKFVRFCHMRCLSGADAKITYHAEHGVHFLLDCMATVSVISVPALALSELSWSRTSYLHLPLSYRRTTGTSSTQGKSAAMHAGEKILPCWQFWVESRPRIVFDGCAPSLILVVVYAISEGPVILQWYRRIELLDGDGESR